MTHAVYGDWIEVEEVLLRPEERAPRLPEDTRKTPLKQWMKGKLLVDRASIGDEVEIETLIGRTVKGIVSNLDPRHTHDFGEYVKELMDVGIELRKEMETL